MEVCFCFGRKIINYGVVAYSEPWFWWGVISRWVTLGTASQVTQWVKNLPAGAGDTRDVGSVPGSGRSPGGGDGNPFEYSCLENPINKGAWGATVHSVAELNMTEHAHMQLWESHFISLNFRVFFVKWDANNNNLPNRFVERIKWNHEWKVFCRKLCTCYLCSLAFPQDICRWESEANILYRGFDNYDLLSYLPGALDVSPRVSLSSRRGSPGHRHWLAGSCVNTWEKYDFSGLFGSEIMVISWLSGKKKMQFDFSKC